MITYNVIFTLYGGIKAINGIKAESEKEAIQKALMECKGYPVHFKKCVKCIY